jgi:hypothetical protein
MMKTAKGILFFIALLFANGTDAQEEENAVRADSSGIVVADAGDSSGSGGEDIPGYPLNLREDDLSSFEVLDSIADHSRFIFTGEDHRVEKLNTTLELKMMKYLNSRGYRYYLMEAGFASQWLLNRYAVDKDSAAGEVLKNYYSPHFFNMFAGIRKLNDSLPQEQKIHAVALDIERDVPLALRMLWMLLPQQEVSDSMEMFVESLKMFAAIQEARAKDEKENFTGGKDLFDFAEYGDDFPYEGEYVFTEEKYFYFRMVTTVRDLTDRFRKNKEGFEDLLESNYTLFEKVIGELENWLVWINYEQNEMPQSWVYREQYMERNFREFFSGHPEGKGFGQFGRCHITRITKVGDCGFAFFTSLNKRLINKMPELKNKLVSIGIFYPDLEKDRDYKGNKGIESLADRALPGTATLFIDAKELGEQEIAEKFSCIIVVKSTVRDKRSRTKPGGIREKQVRKGIELIRGGKQFDFSNLNAQLRYDLPSRLDFWQIGLDMRINGGFCTKSAFTVYSGNTSRLGDSAEISLGGWNYHALYGKDLMKASWLDLVPMLGFGIEQLSYKETRHDLSSAYFGNAMRTEYRNPAFYFDGRLELNLNIRFFSLKAFGGYALDVSKQKWRQHNRLVSTSPSTSLSGYYFGFGVSFYNTSWRR